MIQFLECHCVGDRIQCDSSLSDKICPFEIDTWLQSKIWVIGVNDIDWG